VASATARPPDKSVELTIAISTMASRGQAATNHRQTRDFGKNAPPSTVADSPRIKALKAYAQAIKEAGGSPIGNSRQVADFPAGSWTVEEKK